MKGFIFIFAFVLISMLANSQETDYGLNGDNDHRFLLGSNAGVSCSYTDEAFNFSLTASTAMDYHIKNGYYVQIAPRYTWLIKWNEHYLTIPLHIRKRFGKRLSLYAGPSITWDIGYFRDLGISAGVYFHITGNSAIILSAFTFTLYDYHIDYLYIPVGISYSHCFLKK
jgi:hypothetical protein